MGVTLWDHCSRAPQCFPNPAGTGAAPDGQGFSGTVAAPAQCAQAGLTITHSASRPEAKRSRKNRDGVTYGAAMGSRATITQQQNALREMRLKGFDRHDAASLNTAIDTACEATAAITTRIATRIAKLREGERP